MVGNKGFLSAQVGSLNEILHFTSTRSNVRVFGQGLYHHYAAPLEQSAVIH